MAIRRIPTSSLFASLVLLVAAASCSGNSKGGGGSNDSGGEGGEAANPGSGGGGNRGGSAGAGRGGGGGKAGAGGTSFGSGGEGAANHAGGTQGGDAGAVGTGSAGDAGGDGEGGIGGGSGASHGGSAGVTHGEGGAGFGGEPGTGAVSGAGAGGSAGTTGATGGTTGATGGSAGDAGTSGGAGGEPGGAGGEPGGAGGDDAGAGGEGGAGACDHDAVIIAEGDKAWGLALDATHVYFTERALDGSVRRVAKAGGSVETISEGEPFPAAIAVSGQRVFWSVVGTGSGSGQMVEGATTGGSRQALFEEPEHGIFSLVADEEALYYTTYYNVLKRVALEDGAASQVSGGPFNSFIVDVALDAGELYWTNDGVGHFAATEPESAAVHAGPTQVVSRLNFPLFEIAVAGGGIYFNDDEAIHRVGVAGGPTSVVVALPPAARKEESPIADLSADGEFVFYADRDAVYRVPAIGGAPTVVTEGWRAIGKLAADDEYLYFTDNERGAVVRVEKCAVSNGTASTNPVDAPPAVAAVEPPACTGEPGPHGCPEPEVIETIASPYGLALDASHVYYSTYGTSGSIRREPLGGGEPLVIAPNEVRAHDIAVTDEYVLWSQLDTTAGHLAKAPKTGGARTPLATGVGSYGVGRVTSDGTFAYYVTGFNSIYRVALAGGPWSIVAAGPFGSNAVDVALFDGELFWANDGLWNSNFTAKLANTAYTAKAHAAGSTTLSGFTLDAPLDYPLYRIAVDANAVYYIDDALLYRVSRSGGEVTELGSIAPASGVIVDLETDGQNLYFADLTSVYRMPVTGGDVVTLTSGWAGLRTIAVNADSLYFTDFTGGAVLRMPK